MPSIDSLDTKTPVAKRSLWKHDAEKEVRNTIPDNSKGMTAAELHTHAAETKRAHRTDPVGNPIGSTRTYPQWLWLFSVRPPLDAHIRWCHISATTRPNPEGHHPWSNYEPAAASSLAKGAHMPPDLLCSALGPRTRFSATEG